MVYRARGRRVESPRNAAAATASQLPRVLTLPQARLAQITEIIHVASLIHDDVVDDGTMRRGIPTINAAHGSKTAVLAGDFLLARAR
jgi:geranylgeranyl pyrophosphate synthase